MRRCRREMRPVLVTRCLWSEQVADSYHFLIFRFPAQLLGLVVAQ